MQKSFLSYSALLHKVFSIVGLSVLLVVTVLLTAERATSQIVFKNPGSKSTAQLLKDLQNGAVIMTISLRPGDEDFPLLAYLRFEKGCKIRNVYITNGESIPSRSESDPDEFMGGVRKLEAAKSMATLDAGAYFLNLPDPGVAGSSSMLDSLWGSTLTDQLAIAIQRLHPHVVILMPWNAVHARASFVGERLRKSTEVAMTEARRDSLVWSQRDSTFLPPWEVQAAWMTSSDKDKGISASVTSIVERRLIQRSIGVYHSRRVAPSGNWQSSRYVRIWPTQGNDSVGFADGLQMASAEFTEVRQFIQDLYREKDRNLLLSKVAFAISRIDPYVAQQVKSLAAPDRYALTEWKQDLEQLRFRLLDVKLQVSISDSIVTRLQIFYVRVRFANRASMSNGDTYVFFTPSNSRGWLYSLKNYNYLKLAGPDTTISVITPESLEFNYPFNRFGMQSWKVGDAFTFFVVHKDNTPEKSYLAKFSVDLLHPPVGVVEVTSPTIAWNGDPAVSVRVMSASRDRRTGMVFVSDSVCSSKQYQITASGKDAVIDTSITLEWHKKPGASPAYGHLRNARAIVDSFEVVALDVAVDTARSAALFTDRRRTPYAAALRRLHTHHKLFGLDELEKVDLSRFSTVILDREKSDRPLSTLQLGHTMEWVRGGGHLLLLNARFQDDSLGVTVDESVSVAPDETVEWTNPAVGFARAPNALTQSDWENWKFARAWQGLRTTGKSASEICLRSSSGGVPLIIRKSVGRGDMTVCVLNLGQQLEAFQIGAYRIVANLLSSPQ